MNQSPIDLLFESIFGYLPNKKGTAYEIIAAIVTQILEENASVVHDSRIEGVFSQTLYQIDVLSEKDNRKAFGEAKDYTIKDKKVGRDDIQKMAGALRDVNMDEGLFFSATGFTKPAKDYAEASEKIIGKPIQLLHLRTTIEQDEKGRIKSIQVDIPGLVPKCQDGKYKPIWTSDGDSLLEKLIQEDVVKENTTIGVFSIYDANGNIIYTIQELTHELINIYWGSSITQEAIGCIPTPNGHIKIQDKFVPIHGIDYSIPLYEIVETVIVQADGNVKLLVKSEDGKVNKLITDTQLSNYVLDNKTVQMQTKKTNNFNNIYIKDSQTK
ncbi:restriction endonuclease [Sphaerospermopsis torques-reginae]|uniref:Restriction endonuclease n=1 Tax=Sphaerospermopsis torques-reginae ITEP-024 TaxID=984208 RepID=A0ABX8WWI3_9CYAN|nr:restriction endonuclease [Sphaerospermopsis torques-reginae]QYX30742.1 restriction endonuclease [Sphaerospermopsis torques-reginae ITEP-024]